MDNLGIAVNATSPPAATPGPGAPPAVYSFRFRKGISCSSHNVSNLFFWGGGLVDTSNFFLDVLFCSMLGKCSHIISHTCMVRPIGDASQNQEHGR